MGSNPILAVNIYVHHGYWSYCREGNCKVCNTLLPESKIFIKSPIEIYLEKIGYYKNYIVSNNGCLVPKGIKGKELLDIRKKLDNEYKILENKKCIDNL